MAALMKRRRHRAPKRQAAGPVVKRARSRHVLTDGPPMLAFIWLDESETHGRCGYRLFVVALVGRVYVHLLDPASLRPTKITREAFRRAPRCPVATRPRRVAQLIRRKQADKQRLGLRVRSPKAVAQALKALEAA